MQQFFLPETVLEIGRLEALSDEISRQLVRVLRVRGGEQVRLIDAKNRPFLAQLVPKGRRVSAEVIEQISEVRETPFEIRLFMARIKKERFEWMLQKCTELGVTTIHPLTTAYTTVKAPHSKENQQVRHERIIQEAAEQSERHIVPVLGEMLDFNALAGHLAEVNIFAYERSDAHAPTLTQRLSELAASPSRPKSVSLLIGPEGGFSPEEAEAAVVMGFLPTSLGARVLRAETAAVLGVGMIAQMLA